MLETFALTTILIILMLIISALIVMAASKLSGRAGTVIIFTLMFIILFCLVHDFRNGITQNTATADIK